MIRSMTGWGEAERETAAGRLRAEIKTVNHRNFSASVKLPPALDRVEPSIREWVRAILPRGHATIVIRLETPDGDAADAPALALNEAKARQYIGLLRSLKDRFELPGDVDVALVSRYGDLIERAEPPRIEIAAEDVRHLVEAAARAVVAMRDDEGRRLRSDLEERIEAIAAAVREIEERAPARLVAERDRLRRAVAELADGVEVDEDRLAREVAFLAERWDISEELVRLRSHMEYLRDALRSEDPEPVGKRLAFLIQELHREANTIGSKANDAAIGHRVVAVKNEIERLREQVENVE